MGWWDQDFTPPPMSTLESVVGCAAQFATDVSLGMVIVFAKSGRSAQASLVILNHLSLAPVICAVIRVFL